MRYVLAVSVAALAAAGGASAVRVHTLALAGRSPVLVVGTGFAPNAPVRVSVTTGKRHLTRVVRSSQAGRLHAQWSQSVPPCSVVALTATATNDRLMTRSLPASTAPCGGPSGPPGPPVVGP